MSSKARKSFGILGTGSSGIPLTALQHCVPHEPDGVMLQEITEASGLTVALTLDDAHRGGHVAPGDLVLLAGFGGGMAIGAGSLRWAVTA